MVYRLYLGGKCRILPEQGDGLALVMGHLATQRATHPSLPTPRRLRPQSRSVPVHLRLGLSGLGQLR